MTESDLDAFVKHWRAENLGETEENLGETDARRARDEALGRVDRNADNAWKQEAHQALRTEIRRVGIGGMLTTDDLKCSDPREPRAWGPIVLKAAKAGLIVKAGQRESTNVRCHARPKTLWRVVAMPD